MGDEGQRRMLTTTSGWSPRCEA